MNNQTSTENRPDPRVDSPTPCYLAAFEEYFEKAWGGSNEGEKRIGRTISVYAWNSAISAAIAEVAKTNGELPIIFEKVGNLMVR